jgi:DNA-binding NtrC family response regulator
MENHMAVPRSTVLVVDDEPLIRLGLALTFEDHGFEVVEAGNVLEAIAILSRRSVDAVVTDVDMPGGLSGLDLVDLVSALSLAVVVVVSGRALPPGFELPPGVLYLPKPYSAHEIIEIVRRAVVAKNARHSPSVRTA